MTLDELQLLVRKYKYLSTKYQSIDENKANVYERFAEFLEDYSGYMDLTDADNEDNFWEHFKEVEAEYDNYWNVAFPNGHDNDEITDWMTNE